MTVNSPSGSTMQCDTWLWDDMPLNSPSSSTLQCDTYLCDHDIEFASWQQPQHPAVWQVAVGWHAMEFAETSAILEFYTWFRFWPYHRSRHVILHQSAKFYPNWTTLSRKKTSCRFSRWRISAILDFRGAIMGSLKSSCTTSYRSSRDTMALNCCFFLENPVFAIWRQTDRWTDGHACCMKSRRLNNNSCLLEVHVCTCLTDGWHWIWQKAPHGGPIPRLGVTQGGRKLYHWIPGVWFPISVP